MKNIKIFLVGIGLCLAIAFSILYLNSAKAPLGTPSQGALAVPPPAPIQSTTQVSAQSKASPYDPDLKLQQTYTAEVNGTVVTIPITSSEVSANGTTGIVSQEINLAPLVSYIKASERKSLVKNWEVSTGVGLHNKDLYVPIEIQRNYSTTKALSVEIHLDPSSFPKVTGGEIKHTWKF